MGWVPVEHIIFADKQYTCLSQEHFIFEDNKHAWSKNISISKTIHMFASRKYHFWKQYTCLSQEHFTLEDTNHVWAKNISFSEDNINVWVTNIAFSKNIYKCVFERRTYHFRKQYTCLSPSSVVLVRPFCLTSFASITVAQAYKDRLGIREGQTESDRVPTVLLTWMNKMAK